MKKSLFVIAAVAFVSSAPSAAKKKPQLSGLALQQMQAKDYEANKEISFPAVMTVLQDAGYRISTADRDTGLITGSASTKGKTTWAPFVGFGRSKKTPVVSAFIEERGAGSRIRLNFVLAKVKANMYGAGLSDEEPITDALIYKSAFEKIEQEIFVRQALKAPKAAPVAAIQPLAQPADVAQPAASQASPTP